MPIEPLCYSLLPGVRLRRTFTSSFICLWLFLSLPQACAQHEGHAGQEVIGYVPREILEQPVKLRPGIGRVHEPVTTSSPEAQGFYDQGLAYLYSFVWIEAARSFHQALRLDPKLAMAYLGLSYSYSGLEVLFGYGRQGTRKTASRGRLLPFLCLARPPTRLLS